MRQPARGLVALGDAPRCVDIGAGTGTLEIAIAARRPDAQVIAVDRDPRGAAARSGQAGGSTARPGAGGSPASWTSRTRALTLS